MEMACEKKLWLVVLVFLAATCYKQICVHGDGDPQPQVPCLFIFGDSLSDSGNNNDLATDSKVNYFPYGIDFPTGSTGRFTNGRTTADIITQLLGFKNFIPPFANTSGSDILQGVNYASGGAGIRNETGTQLGADVSLEAQLGNHKVTTSKIAERLGGVEKARQHLNKCLYFVNIGSNDYINNYFAPHYFPTSHTYRPQEYAEALIQQYSQQIKALYQTGARKFVMFGLGLVGCTPHEILAHGGKGSSTCIQEENEAVRLFNDKLKSLVDQFNNELPDAKFVYINIALISSSSPQLAGLKGFPIHCCQVGENGQCLPDKTPCQERKLHAFWDAFHPTEIVNQVIARSAYHSVIPFITHPMDIRKLVML